MVWPKRFFLFLALLLTAFLTSCTPKREQCSVPSYLRFDNIPSDFSGTLYISTFKVPFKYKVSQNRIVFPLTYLGFISYKSTTLRVGKYKIDFYLPLWRILKHRLVGKSCKMETYRCFTLIETETAKGIKIYLTTDPGFKPLKAKICSISGCYKVFYEKSRVKVDMDQVKLVFDLFPFQ